MKRRPTRKDLLKVISRLQDLTGVARAIATDDRNKNRYAKTDKALETAFNLCVEALGQDPPVKTTGEWGKSPDDDVWKDAV